VVVTAAGLADVLVGDPQPVVALGLGQHPFEKLAVAVLDVAAIGEDRPHVGDPAQQPVADLLQLGDPEQARAAGGRHLI
jgi:hypothetical protein